MRCRVCSCGDLRHLWFDNDSCEWLRCQKCGSDNNAVQYDQAGYGADYVRLLLEQEGTNPVANHIHNIDMIDRHVRRPGRLLDVGTAHGCSQAAAKARGWETFGFDVSADGRPEGTIVAKEFSAELFPHRFEAVLCREVLEHVEDGVSLLWELIDAVEFDGVCEVTTPRPIEDPTEIRVYQRAHLCVFSVMAMTESLEDVGFEVLESSVWELGQRYVVGKRW